MENFLETVGVVCHPCQAAGNLSDVVYSRRFTGEGPTYMERLKGRLIQGVQGVDGGGIPDESYDDST